MHLRSMYLKGSYADFTTIIRVYSLSEINNGIRSIRFAMPFLCYLEDAKSFLLYQSLVGVHGGAGGI